MKFPITLCVASLVLGLLSADLRADVKEIIITAPNGTAGIDPSGTFRLNFSKVDGVCGTLGPCVVDTITAPIACGVGGQPRSPEDLAKAIAGAINGVQDQSGGQACKASAKQDSNIVRIAFPRQGVADQVVCCITDFDGNGAGQGYVFNTTTGAFCPPLKNICDGAAGNEDPASPQVAGYRFRFRDVVQPVPTVSEWGLIGLSLLLAGGALWVMRRRRALLVG